MTEIRPEDRLLEEIGEQGKKTLHYSRTRLLATWLAIALLAMLTGIALFLSIQNGNTNNDQTEEIARVANTNAEHASKQADQTTAYLKGDTGIPGVPGANGEDGAPGIPSEPGPEGPAGPKGENGAAGTAGVPGIAGMAGTSGPIGATGQAGSTGTTGATGARGPAGPDGEKGATGDKGATGATGPTGPPGPQGPAGPPGFNTTAISFAASANDTTAHKQITVTCPNGRASGGGFATVPSDPGIDVSASSPVGNTGWSATADVLSLPAGTNWQLLAFVTCVS